MTVSSDDPSGAPAAANPPVEPLDADERPVTRWPRVIGTISLIYALGGLLCQAGSVASAYLSEWLMSLGSIDMEVPGAIKVWTAAAAVVNVILGIVMLMGAVSLLRRRRRGVSLLKAWALLRVIVIVAGLSISIFMMPVQMEFQGNIQEASAERMREAGRSDLARDFDEDQARLWALLGMAGGTAATAAYPVFLAFYLSRRRIDDEVKHWEMIG